MTTVGPTRRRLGPSAGLHDLEALTAGLRGAGVEVELDVGPIAGLPAPVHSTGYRIVQEALTNVARHADASRASVHVRRGPEAVTIEVSDNGVSTNGVASTPGNGLRGMRERAAAVGGSVDAGHHDGGGWQVRANLPLTGSVGNASAADGASP